MKEFGRAAILGTGMIGGSVAGALRRAGLVGELVGFDALGEHAQSAVERGLFDRVAATEAQAVEGADLVILAVPVGATEAVCRAIGPVLARQPSTLVTDVGSTKVAVLEAVRRTLPGPQRFVGAHPMAGSERSGPEAADADLFANKVCFVITDGADAGALERCTALWRGLGMITFTATAEEHDQLVAFGSHLPHAVAFALARAVGEEPEVSRATGGGFVGTTRIAASSPIMWRDVFLTNRAPVLRALTAFEARLHELRRAVEAGDAAALESLLEAARERRRDALPVTGPR